MAKSEHGLHRLPRISISVLNIFIY